jgi:hypothetical protein
MIPRKLFLFIQILLPRLSKNHWDSHYERISLNKQRVANKSRVEKGKKGAKTRVGWCIAVS